MASSQTWSGAEQEIDTDCIITVHGSFPDNPTTFKFHKAILMRSSPVFQRMFEIDMSESRTGIINITDIKPRIMDNALRHMYGCDEFDKNLSCADIQDLLYVADKYEIHSLPESCAKYAVSNLLSLNIISFLLKLRPSILNLNCKADLEKQLLEVFEHHTKEFIASDGALDITKEELIMILKLEKCNLNSELDFIKFVDCWAVHNIEKHKNEIETRKIPIEYYVRDLIKVGIRPLIRFLTLTEQEFIGFCIEYNWFTRFELKLILLEISEGKPQKTFPPNLSRSKENRCRGQNIFTI